MPAVCRFYIKGYCRYGRNCRFEHPGESKDVVGNTSFSFKAALNESSGGATGGFSFTRALETIRTNPNPIVDVDMSDVANFSTTTGPTQFNSSSFASTLPLQTQQLTPATSQYYSKVSDLDEAEVKAFEKSTFAFRAIPIKPPPEAFCQ